MVMPTACPPSLPSAADAGVLGRHSVSSALGLGFHQAAHLCRTTGLALRRGGAICQDPHALQPVLALESTTPGPSSGF